ncbi:unnamed protein product [Arctia plantaginis]|uniref:ZAD domain-containing protein n=1 Tax=Arctia plantaginis TaxID=874455 RepID=A0A8S0ZR29_ARCPL|nr:unnamed protein product [Arctia plantaginis]
MGDKSFVWTSELNKKLFQLRFENDWLFKAKKQPWSEFHKLLLENGFPREMTVDHVRKKWSYNYDMYKIAKKTNNRSWKYFKLFDKHFGKSKILDKYESWNDEWRLKLIICISEAKENNLDILAMWRTVERAMRSQELPSDCCIQDIQGLWHHIRMTFNRKHRQKLRKGSEESDWPLYDAMMCYLNKFDPEYLTRLENEPSNVFASCFRDNPRYLKNKNSKNEIEKEFIWSKDITETFIQIRLQHDLLFKQKKWAWNELSKIMIEEYSFPKTLSPRELGRKWAATFAEYQKAKATNNTSWVYHHLFEVYLGESTLSLNPLAGWQEEWVFNLISSRTDLEQLFKTVKDQNRGWREVEKRLRSIGLPLDHSLLDLKEIWTHLLKTFRWKQKFANKGILNEQWPYFEALSRYAEVRDKHSMKEQKEEDSHDHFDDGTHDDEFEDDIKLMDLKKRLQFDVEPKFEFENGEQCRSCSSSEASVDIFEQRDDDGLDLAHKLKIIAGIEVDKLDNLPTQICLNCHEQLQNAYKFRRKCQDVDKQFRCTNRDIKIEVTSKHEDDIHDDTKDEQDIHVSDDMPDVSYEPDSSEVAQKNEPKAKNKKVMVKRQKSKKLKYDYWKICERVWAPAQLYKVHRQFVAGSARGHSADWLISHIFRLIFGHVSVQH